MFINLGCCIYYAILASSLHGDDSFDIWWYFYWSLFEVVILGLFWIVLTCNDYVIPCRCEAPGSQACNGKNQDWGWAFLSVFSFVSLLMRFLVISETNNNSVVILFILSLCNSVYLQVKLVQFYYY